MIRFLGLFSAVLTANFAFADLEPASNQCQVEMIPVGKGVSTPLQQEAEMILKYKGYSLVHPSEASESEIQIAFPFQVRYTVGNESLSGKSDCVTEDYRELGKRSTCQYELEFLALDLTGKAHTAFRIEESIRQSLEVESFYTRVRAQLAQLPHCIRL